MGKSLNITDPNTARKKIADLEVFGDPGVWVCICKASSRSEGWMKSTKAMQLPHGCLIQVSTQQGNHVAEALEYVDGLSIDLSGQHPKLVVSR